MGALTDHATGMAFVEFVSPEEALPTIECHRKNIGSDNIEHFKATKRYKTQQTSIHNLFIQFNCS